MNPAESTKKRSVTATNMRSPIVAARFVVAIPALLSETLWLHEGIEQVNEKASGTEAGQPGHEDSSHGSTPSMSEEMRARAALIRAHGLAAGPVGRSSDLLGG
jgi:hypothetical protein